MAQMYDVCEMYRDRFGKTVFKARPRTNIPYTIARSVVRMLNLDKSKPYGTFFKPVKNGTDPIIREKHCRWCNGQYNKYCNEITNCLTVTLEAEEKLKNFKQQKP